VSDFRHLSVLSDEVLELLYPRPGGIYLDGTLGGGGHTELILEKICPDGIVIGVDRDREALAAASVRLERFGSSFIAIHGSFGELAQLLKQQNIEAVDGVLLDLGVSSYQLDTAERGFSFRQDGLLDMRMDPSKGETAANILENLSVEELERIIKEYGEERWARKIAQSIERERQEKAIVKTLQLAELVSRAIPRRFHEERIHPATRTFQALRIAVNNELEQVRHGVSEGISVLKQGGRIVVISFHSLEDRIVKQLFREAATGCICPPRLPYCICNKKPLVRVLTNRPIRAGEDEVNRNPRARSAKLRAAEKSG